MDTTMETPSLHDAVETTVSNAVHVYTNQINKLKEWIKDQGGNAKCVTCNTPITGISIQRMTRPYRWCCRECFEFKPGKIIELELEYDMDIEDILIETTKMYGNLKTQCSALGISIPYLYKIIKKYFGDYQSFMLKNSTGSRKLGYKNKIKVQ